jgi:NAD(P)-dependent dehydrogenase (short-subunit alcohol dehydrogenase family)
MWEHDLAGGLRMLRMGVDTHLVTAHAALPLLLGGDRGLLVEMTDGTAEVNAAYREVVGFFYDLVKANVSRIIASLAHELRDTSVTALGVTPGWLRSEAMLEGFGSPRRPGATPWPGCRGSRSRSRRPMWPAGWPPLPRTRRWTSSPARS